MLMAEVASIAKDLRYREPDRVPLNGRGRFCESLTVDADGVGAAPGYQEALGETFE